MFRTDEYAIQKQLMNQPQVITNQTDHIGEHLGHLKDLEISKYKRESKVWMSIKFYYLIFVNCGLFSFLNIGKNIKWKHCCRWKCIML
jgi:hypothetical protein